MAVGFGIVGIMTFFGGSLSATDKVKTLSGKLYEEVSQTEENQDYYQKAVAELDTLKQRGIITEDRYEVLKNDLKDAVRYVNQLPDKEKAQFKEYIEKIEKAEDAVVTTFLAGTSSTIVGFLLGILEIIIRKREDKQAIQNSYRSYLGKPNPNNNISGSSLGGGSSSGNNNGGNTSNNSGNNRGNRANSSGKNNSSKSFYEDFEDYYNGYKDCDDCDDFDDEDDLF